MENENENEISLPTPRKRQRLSRLFSVILNNYNLGQHLKESDKGKILESEIRREKNNFTQ